MTEREVPAWRQPVSPFNWQGLRLHFLSIPGVFMKFQSVAFAGLVAILGYASLSEAAAQAKPRTIADLHQNKAALAGKTIRAQGTVVKANNGIRGYNFVHVQDGTGAAGKGTNNLIVRSRQTANAGDKVTVSGVVVVNRDFGSGYFYPLLIEEASITPKK
jgi:hypothetical protein